MERARVRATSSSRRRSSSRSSPSASTASRSRALNGDFLTDTINRAIDAGIPVVTWDSDAPKSKRIAFYGVDDYASGKIMGEQAIKLLNGKGKVAIITSLGATNLQNRLEGVA